MSFDAIAWAMQQATASSASKFVLVALADAARKDDWVAWPAVPRLAATTQQDAKTVRRCLALLEADGFIQRHAADAGKATRWKLNPAPPSKPGNTDNSSSTPPKNGRGTPPKGGRGTHTKFGRGTPDDPSQNWDGGLPKVAGVPLPNLVGNPVRRTCQSQWSAPVPAEQSKPELTRLPANWTVPADWQQWAREARPDLDVSTVADTFARHWAAATGDKGLSTNWRTKWEAWVRRERASQGIGGTVVPIPNLDAERTQQYLREQELTAEQRAVNRKRAAQIRESRGLARPPAPAGDVTADAGAG